MSNIRTHGMPIPPAPFTDIREKVIAAKRAGIKELILPESCHRDFKELPAHIRKGLKVHFAQQYRDVFEVVFGKKK